MAQLHGINVNMTFKKLLKKTFNYKIYAIYREKIKKLRCPLDLTSSLSIS